MTDNPLDAIRRLSESRPDPSKNPAAEMQAQVDRLMEVFAGFNGREFEGASDEGEVEVSVDGAGSVRRVYVSPKAFRSCDNLEIARAAMDAVRAAREAAAEGSKELFSERLGVDLSGGPAIVDENAISAARAAFSERGRSEL